MIIWIRLSMIIWIRLSQSNNQSKENSKTISSCWCRLSERGGMRNVSVKWASLVFSFYFFYACTDFLYFFRSLYFMGKYHLLNYLLTNNERIFLMGVFFYFFKWSKNQCVIFLWIFRIISSPFSQSPFSANV